MKRDLSDRSVIITIGQEINQAMEIIYKAKGEAGKVQSIEVLCHALEGMIILFDRYGVEGRGDYLEKYLAPWEGPVIL